MTLNPPTWRDHVIGAVLGLLAASLLVSTSPDVGIPRDESFYFYAGDKAGDWVLGILDGKVPSFTRAEIEKGFGYNHEHPVLMKTLFGLSHRVFHDRLGLIDSNILAYRLPSIGLAGLTVWLTYLLGFLIGGRGVGLVAGLAYTFMPRVFFHSHFACFDGPVTFMWLLIVYTWLRGTRSRRWGVASGVALGLGMATKLNTFFVPFLLLVVTFFDAWSFRRRTGAWRAAGEARGPITYGLWTGLSMIFLGTLVFFAHWPWMWFDTWKRIQEYVGFHTHHVNYPVAYLGTLWYDPPFPPHYPFVMSLVTLPVATLLLAAIGVGVLWMSGWNRLNRKQEGPPVEMAVLANLAVPFFIIAMPGTPIFGGIKHWMTAMPFLAVAAGLGMERALRGMLEGAVPRDWAVALVGAMLLGPAVTATLRNPGYGEAYYNELVGGAPGAAERDLPRNFWGYATQGALPALNTQSEPGALAFWHDATRGAFDAYKQDTLLRKDIKYTGDWTAAYSNWGVYHDQRDKFWEELDLWRAYGTDWPVDGVFYDGVQLVGLYRRPLAPQAPAALRPKNSAPPDPTPEREDQQAPEGQTPP